MTGLWGPVRDEVGVQGAQREPPPWVGGQRVLTVLTVPSARGANEGARRLTLEGAGGRGEWAVDLVAACQSLTLGDPLDSSPPGSSVQGILRRKYWRGLPCPPPGDLPDSGIEPMWASGFFTASATWEAQRGAQFTGERGVKTASGGRDDRGQGKWKW